MMTTSLRGLLVILGTLTMPIARATCQNIAPPARTDSTPTTASDSSRRLVSRRDLAMFLGAALATTALAPLDGTVQHAMMAEDVHDDRSLRATARELAFLGGPGPFVGGGSLYLVGRAARSNRIATLGVTLTEGALLAATLNGLIKGVSGRALPNATTTEPGDFSFGRGFHDNNGSFVSFPSGHTAASFATAAVVANTLNEWNPCAARIIGPAAYGTASLVAVSRLYQNVHWASDLPLGAAIGIWSGRTVVAWQRHHAENWFTRRVAGLVVAPSARGLTIGETIDVQP